MIHSFLDKKIPLFSQIKKAVFNNDIIKVVKYQLQIGNFQGIGKRAKQEDSFYISDFTKDTILQEKGFLAVVADGMGGMENGAQMSAIITGTAKEYFEQIHISGSVSDEDMHLILMEFLKKIYNNARSIMENPEEEDSGSTLTAVWIMEAKLYFVSVGDSRIYLHRNGEIFLLNREHNLGTQLAESMAKGIISLEEYRDITGKAGLTSFIGITDLKLYDISHKALKLQKGDTILLMSDGVFGTLSDAEISEAICKEDAGCTSKNLKEAIEMTDKPKQDNYTGVIIQIGM